MAQGTIKVTNGSVDVVGTGTAFTSMKAGSFLTFVLTGVAYTVAIDSIQSDTALKLAVKFDGPTTIGVAFNESPVGSMALATMGVTVQAQKALRMMIADQTNWREVFSNKQTITVTLPDGTQYSGYSWGYISELLKDIDVSNLQSIRDDTVAAKNQAQTYASNAASSATAASSANTSAQSAKTAAASSQTAAANSATAAAGSATAASGSATTAGNQANTATQQATLAKQYADSVNPSNLLNKNNNLSDVANVDTAKNNLGLSFIAQTSVSKWAQMYSPGTDGALGRGAYALTMAADGTWGARKTSDGSWSALAIAQGGTGSNSASGARSNLQVDKLVQSSATTNLNFPTKNASLVLRDSDLAWGVYNNDTAKWLALSIGNGGTGANDATGARNNLQLGVSDNPQFNSLTLQPTADGGLSTINLTPYSSTTSSYPRSQIMGMPDGTVQLHEYDASNARKRYFFADQYRNGTSNVDRIVMTNGDFGVGAGASSYSTPANHGPENSFISGGGGGLSWCPSGAGWQSSYDNNRTGQMLIQPNGNVVFRWLQSSSETAISTTAYTTLQNAGTSDINLKHVNGDLDVGLSLANIDAMSFKRFYYLDDEDQTERRGIIAQDIERIDPEYVHSAEQTGKMTIDLNPLVMDALAAIQALSRKVTALETALAAKSA